MNYEIVPASPRHLRRMAGSLRMAACVALARYAIDPRRALHRAYMASHYCRTALIDGVPVAMWGLEGPLIGDTAHVWLTLSDRIAQMPATILREARRELAQIMAGYSEIATAVLPDDDAAIRFALHLGFHDDHNETGSVRDRVQRVKTDPRHRIPVGDSYVIGLGYHGGH